MENSNSKLVSLDALDKIAKELRRKALADISQQEEEIEEVRDMFGGKSFRYVLQEEYDNLSEEEKNDPSIVWSIIDAEESVSKEYVDEEVAKINDMLQHMGEGIKNVSEKFIDVVIDNNNIDIISSFSDTAKIVRKINVGPDGRNNVVNFDTVSLIYNDGRTESIYSTTDDTAPIRAQFG